MLGQGNPPDAWRRTPARMAVMASGSLDRGDDVHPAAASGSRLLTRGRRTDDGVGRTHAARLEVLASRCHGLPVAPCETGSPTR